MKITFLRLLHNQKNTVMKHLIILFYLLGFLICYGQNDANYLTVKKYAPETSQPGLSFFKLPVNFDRSKPLIQVPDSLNTLVVQHIDLVYSENKENPSFDQKRLNQKRISRLKSYWKKVQDPQITWRHIAQDGAKNRSEAQELFHGFVIYYRPTPTKAIIEKELNFIEKELFGASTGSDMEDAVASVEEVVSEDTRAAMNVEIGNTWTHDEIINSEDFKKTETVRPGMKHDFAVYSDMLGCYDLHLFKAFTTTSGQYKIIDSLAHLPNNMGNSFYWETAPGEKPATIYCSWAEKKEDCGSAPTYEHESTLAYETVSFALPYLEMATPLNLDYNVVKEVYARHPTWTNTHVVMDVTGSMAPYIAKTMTWVRETESSPQVSAFTFFNDGDATPHHLKRTGKVGGIYSTENTNFKTVYAEMQSTMKKGGGGDCPENNIEAVLKGLKTHPNCDEIIMVADNWATPRDLSLVEEIGKPVHVILCGASAAINVDYIQLAYDTGGSIHTIEEDLEAKNIKPGKMLKIGQTYYTLSKGKIVIAKNYY